MNVGRQRASEKVSDFHLQAPRSDNGTEHVAVIKDCSKATNTFTNSLAVTDFSKRQVLSCAAKSGNTNS